MLLINLLESLIASYTLFYLARVNKKRYIIINTILTFVVELIFNVEVLNGWPLLFSLIALWYIVLLFYTKKQLLYNLIIIILTNLIIDMSIIVPLLVISNVDVLMVSLIAKLIQLLLSTIVVKYMNIYVQISIKYWIYILVLSLCSMVILEIELQNFDIRNPFVGVVKIILLCIITVLSFSFISILDQSNKEIKNITLQLEDKKYTLLSNDLIKYSINELEYLSHLLRYYMINIKNCINNDNIEGALDVINGYIDKVDKHGTRIVTGNINFDKYISTKLSENMSNITTCINIPRDDFYNSMNFINILMDIFIIFENIDMNIIINDKITYCSMQISSIKSTLSEEQIRKFIDNHKNYIIKNSITIENSVINIDIIIRKMKNDRLYL